ncbi:hypothetical protein [Selenomonas sp.]|uniref:hypothetical protein n=1 Tax=Selenomonas sp. TaxID=2053611 RepID=UPI0025E76370|nr:hypothetical protein [Selenomonas sp.]
MNNERQAGFFLWETILLCACLVAMAAGVRLYAQAAELRVTQAVEGRADYLARGQFAYAQALLGRDGVLPADMEYLGDEGDLQQNNAVYRVRAEAVEAEGLWQLRVVVSWEVNGRYGEQEYKRSLVRLS